MAAGVSFGVGITATPNADSNLVRLKHAADLPTQGGQTSWEY